MTTLYELLGALPHDDAEGLRTAFRKAAKATHPDANPEDPDASLRFRQIVRAHDILTDDEQRAVYDQLLTIAIKEPGAKSKRTVIYETIHKLASNTIAATVISAVLVAGYVFFGPVIKISALPEKAIEMAARPPVEVAAITPAITPMVQSDAIARVEPREAREDTPGPAADEVTTTGTLWPREGTEPIANIDLLANLSVNEAKFYRKRGIFAYRDGDLNRALADFDLAIERDPNYAEAYIDRGIVLYRMRQFDRAFADMTRAKRIEGSNRTKTTASAHRISPVRVRDTLNIAASDRYLDVPIQSTPSERRR
jgi:curved DNA-binding protein CbpA